VLDIVRAAGHLPHVDASDRTFIYGHSQSGQAALFAGEIASTYAPELQILGIIAGAPAAEIEAMLPAAAATPLNVGYVVMARRRRRPL
jgi:Secretory lipase